MRSVINFLERMYTDPTFPWYGRFHNFIAFVIFVSCLGIAVETLSDFVEKHEHIINFFENFTLAIFVLEYIGNLAFAKNRLKFVLDEIGVSDTDSKRN